MKGYLNIKELIYEALNDYGIKQHFRVCYHFIQIAFILSIFPLYSTHDVTMVGFVQPEDGIGKVSINIIETLDDKITVNFKTTNSFPLNEMVPPRVIKALENPDQSAGKIALFTDLLWHTGMKPSASVPKESLIKIAYSMVETTRIPNMWVDILNREFDAVVVPDKYLVNVYEDSGVTIPIFVLPIPMRLDTFYDHPIHPKSPSTPFIFGDASANKEPLVLIQAFERAFGNNPDVQLVMRAGILSHENWENMKRLISQLGLTNITIESGHINLEQYISRLASFDCYVNLSRGEGFSFIPREALALGIPVIITNNTASTTICDSGFIRAVPSYKKGPSNHYINLFNDSCCEQFGCEVNDVVAALRDVYEHYDKYIKKARKGRNWVTQYNCTNPSLRNRYSALIKPKKVKLGNRNEVQKGTIITNSKELYKKYKQIVDGNK